MGPDPCLAFARDWKKGAAPAAIGKLAAANVDLTHSAPTLIFDWQCLEEFDK
jgi:hypothetical protein